jgi:Glycosyltransferase family 87
MRRIRPLDLGLYVQVPVMAVAFVAWQVIRKGWDAGFLGDFRIFRAAGHALVHGHSPYVQPTAQLLTGDKRFVYPAPIGLLFAPFNLVGPTAACLLFLVVSAAAVMLAARLLGVTDWRCYGAALAGAGAYESLIVGSIGPLLILALAAAWRYRDRAVAGVLLALVAAAKMFLWPVLVWLVATRRLRGAAAAVATLGALVGLWALIDLDGLREYPTTLHVLDRVERWKSYSPESLVIALGGGAGLAHAVAVGIAVLGVIAIVVWRRDDRRALTIAIIAALLASPILWLHYLVLLVVPIGLAAPTLTPLWALPVVLWPTIKPEAGGVLWRLVLALAVVALTAGLTLLPGRAPSRARKVGLGATTA